MEFLKEIFGDKALTFEELQTTLKDNKDVKLANLAGGQYVDKKKLDDKIIELGTANQTIADLQAAVGKFDGVDVESLRTQITDLQTQYDNDTKNLKLNSAIDVALLSAKIKNPKLAKAALDTSVIKLDGDKLLGVDEQIAKLKETDGYLFEQESDPAARADSGDGHGADGSPDYDKMTDDEYYKTVLKKE